MAVRLLELKPCLDYPLGLVPDWPTGQLVPSPEH